MRGWPQRHLIRLRRLRQLIANREVANSIFRRNDSICRDVDRDTDGTIRACVVRVRIPTGSQMPRSEGKQGERRLIHHAGGPVAKHSMTAHGHARHERRYSDRKLAQRIKELASTVLIRRPSPSSVRRRRARCTDGLQDRPLD
jgi:hypothetical protein